MEIELEKLYKLLTTLKESHPVEEKLSRIIRVISELVSIQSMGIYMCTKGVFRCKITRNISHTFQKSSFFSSDDDIVAQLASGKRMEFKDPQSLKFEFNYEHLIMLPLTFQKKFLGFVFVDREKNLFTEEEILKLELFASIISIVIMLSQIQSELERTCEFDPMLNLYNLKYFAHRGEYIFSLMKRFDQKLTLYVFKISNYYELVRKTGKDCFNSQLIRVSNFLKKSLDSYEIIGIIDNDTYAVLVPEQDVAEINEKFKRINNEILQLTKEEWHLSWGACRLTKNIHTFKEMISNAEESAFEASRIVKDNSEEDNFTFLLYQD